MVSLSDSFADPFAGTVNEDELPTLRGWIWNTHHPREYECGTTAVTAWRQSTGRTESLPGEDRFAYVLTAPDEYLLTHAVREIEVPRYYCDFKEAFDPLVAEWTIRRRGRAVGVDAGLLERTVRLAEGKGRIDHDALSLYLCANRTLLVTGSRGTFLVDVVALKDWTFDRTPPDSARVDIKGFAIPEADPACQLALRRFVDIFNDHADATLVRYKRIGDGKHIFVTDSGKDVYAGPQLKHLSRMAVDETELHQTYNHSFAGEIRLSTWDNETTSHALGAETRRGVVIGYEHGWNRKEPFMGGSVYEVESNVTYWCFKPRPEKYSYHDFEIVSFEETIDSFTDRS